MTTDQTTSAVGDQLREQVRAKYASLAEQVTTGTVSSQSDCGCGQPADCGCASGCCGGPAGLAEEEPGIGAKLYSQGERGEVPDAAVLASLGGGNPAAVAQLREGETGLDPGAGGGGGGPSLARGGGGGTGVRPGPGGAAPPAPASGRNRPGEMPARPRRNTAEAGAANVHFLKGHIEAIPLPADTVDVIISNCV